jgi:formylglycine-generating enzyme required for sulfatase activity
VTTIYVEATGEDTEARLVKGLRRHLPHLPDDLRLAESLAMLRHGRFLGATQKVLLVLDQFEQWLHATKEADNTELIQALRQCDGAKVQCLVLVRDDFWMAVSDFMGALEIRLVEGQNSAAVSLFDLRHARKVLQAFGRAYGVLPENATPPTKQQEAFLDQAVAGLAQDRKVIPVRLVLFAEMVKGLPWTPATLKEVGGTEGVGVAFLEETFSASTAPPQHRLHQKAGRAVLKALLPEAGSDIKGHMRSRDELLEVSGYRNRTRDFDDLLRILDSELRLITPTDPEGQEQAEPSQMLAGAKYYQLTHDYLVPSLRAWLTRKQKETWRGWAELRLAERSALWNSKPENRHLPAWWEWPTLRWLTRKRDWTSSQRRMMARAARYHGLWTAVGVVFVLLSAWGLLELLGRLESGALVEALVGAETPDVPRMVSGLDRLHLRWWADPLLRQRLSQSEPSSKEHLHASLALLPVDAAQSDELGDLLLAAKGPEEVKAIRGLLHEHAPDTATKFWRVLQDAQESRSRRLRAGSALALFAPADPRWPAFGDDVVRYLGGENVVALGAWALLLEQERGVLVPPAVRRLVEADPGTFATMLAILSVYRVEAEAELDRQLERKAQAAASLEDRQRLAHEQAQAAVALLHLGRTEGVWPLFHQDADPTRRTYLIHRCAPLGVNPAMLVDRLFGGEEADPSIRQGLLLALGEYDAYQRAEALRGPLVEGVVRAYRDDPDPGVHGAAEWLLRTWHLGDRLRSIDQEVLEARPEREHGEVKTPRWEVNSQGQTFAVLPAPGAFEIGSRPEEKNRWQGEDIRRVQIDYAFAIAQKLVTVAELKKSRPDFDHEGGKHYSPGPDTPINDVSWYDAARYCNWLSCKEQIPQDQWCYEPNGKGEYAEGMKVRPNYWQLKGYRLPREAEWEHACRAETGTPWSHGSEETLLGYYAWYAANAGGVMHPVGTRKPNGWGLFDMHGNAAQWCQEVYGEKDNKDKEEVNNKEGRVFRGGWFFVVAWTVRSAGRSGNVPGDRYSSIGFRVARTYH